jgi:hypothetical protein
MHTKKDWVSKPALEAKTVISYLPDSDRECYRSQVSKRLESPYD